MLEQNLENIGYVVAGLTYLASAVLAASAALQAARHGLDPFGATVLACATALGGGTLRDLCLGLTPVFWVNDVGLLLTVIPIALITHLSARGLDSGTGKRFRLLMRLDAVGLALFTLVGVRVAMDAGTGWIIAIVLGCVTGTVGGMIRDMLCNVTPSVLKEDLYATISLLGGAAYLVLDAAIQEELALGICFAGMLVLRLIAIWKLQPYRTASSD